MLTPLRESSLATRQAKVVVTGLPSDSHTWNLVFLQLYLEERGHQVVNLGPCVPDETLTRECARHQPDLVVVSSVNGHGRADGLRVIRKLRNRPELVGVPIVIGGKLGTTGAQSTADLTALVDAGFDAVFDDNASTDPFGQFLESLTVQQGALRS